jgi:HEPN domain-containing protein
MIFLAAEHAMEMAQEGLTDIVCFHCQQCAEKYLKALLLYRGVTFPRTHDLRLLLDLIPPGISLGLCREQVVPLNRYVIEGRYPGDWEPITVAEAQRALEMARAVRQAVLNNSLEGETILRTGVCYHPSLALNGWLRLQLARGCYSISS